MDAKSNEVLARLVEDILRVGQEEKRSINEPIAAVAVESYRLGYRRGEEEKEKNHE